MHRFLHHKLQGNTAASQHLNFHCLFKQSASSRSHAYHIIVSYKKLFALLKSDLLTRECELNLINSLESCLNTQCKTDGPPLRFPPR